MNHRKTIRKMGLNATVMVAMIFVADVALLLPDSGAAFTINAVATHILIFAAVLAVAWPLYIEAKRAY